MTWRVGGTLFSLTWQAIVVVHFIMFGHPAACLFLFISVFPLMPAHYLFLLRAPIYASPSFLPSSLFLSISSCTLRLVPINHRCSSITFIKWNSRTLFQLATSSDNARSTSDYFNNYPISFAKIIPWKPMVTIPPITVTSNTSNIFSCIPLSDE